MEREAVAKELAIIAEDNRNKKLLAEKKAANLAHRTKINNTIIKGFMAADFTKEQSQIIIGLIITDKIKHITINY